MFKSDFPSQILNTLKKSNTKLTISDLASLMKQKHESRVRYWITGLGERGAGLKPYLDVEEIAVHSRNHLVYVSFNGKKAKQFSLSNKQNSRSETKSSASKNRLSASRGNKKVDRNAIFYPHSASTFQKQKRSD